MLTLFSVLLLRQERGQHIVEEERYRKHLKPAKDDSPAIVDRFRSVDIHGIERQHSD